MSDSQIGLQHFILTRFNIRLWNKDKEGRKVRTLKWLEHRFSLFERYCLPSIQNQTCKNFEWIVLFDSTTPETFKKRMVDYQKVCPQLEIIYVEPERGRYFAEIFREEVVKRLNAKRVVSTYLDNDDALNIHFVEDLQKRLESLSDATFVTYTDGYQFYTDYEYTMQIHYPRNQFVSVVEEGNHATIKTIYGYGSHYYIDKIPGAYIEKVYNLPMWCVVIHNRNMDNDAYFMRAKMVGNDNVLKQNFSLDVTLKHGMGIYVFTYLPRYFKTFIHRCKIKIRGYRFE